MFSRHMAPSPCQYLKKKEQAVILKSCERQVLLLSYGIPMLQSSHVACTARAKQPVHWYLGGGLQSSDKELMFALRCMY